MNRVVAALVLAGLAALGLPRSQAQIRYSGGFVQYHSTSSPFTLRDMTPPPPAGGQASLGSPDNDFYYASSSSYRFDYPSHTSPTTTITRSYSPAEQAGLALSSFGVSAAALPWNRTGFPKYEPPSESSFSVPTQYSLTVVRLPREGMPGYGQVALLVVHLPEQALLWVEGRRIALQGPTSDFHSPPLAPGKKYDYTVRAAWLEEGHMVSQSREVTVEAGLAQAVYLLPVVAVGARR